MSVHACAGSHKVVQYSVHSFAYKFVKRYTTSTRRCAPTYPQHSRTMAADDPDERVQLLCSVDKAFNALERVAWHVRVATATPAEMQVIKWCCTNTCNRRGEKPPRSAKTNNVGANTVVTSAIAIAQSACTAVPIPEEWLAVRDASNTAFLRDILLCAAVRGNLGAVQVILHQQNALWTPDVLHKTYTAACAGDAIAVVYYLIGNGGAAHDFPCPEVHRNDHEGFRVAVRHKAYRVMSLLMCHPTPIPRHIHEDDEYFGTIDYMIFSMAQCLDAARILLSAHNRDNYDCATYIALSGRVQQLRHTGTVDRALINPIHCCDILSPVDGVPMRCNCPRRNVNG